MISDAGAAIDLTMEEAKKTIDTNFFSVLRVAKAVIPAMASRRSGTIVNIGSVAGNV
jgi:1-acylglycerone phosphate reductase